MGHNTHREKAPMRVLAFAQCSLQLCLTGGQVLSGPAAHDWKDTSGPHHDARVVRSCRPGFLVQIYPWAGNS